MPSPRALRGRGWRGCQLINPLCPDDLCDLHPTHPAHAEGLHRLSTFIEPGRVWEGMVVFEGTLSAQQLMSRGTKLQDELVAKGYIA